MWNKYLSSGIIESNRHSIIATFQTSIFDIVVINPNLAHEDYFRPHLIFNSVSSASWWNKLVEFQLTPQKNYSCWEYDMRFKHNSAISIVYITKRQTRHGVFDLSVPNWGIKV